MAVFKEEIPFVQFIVSFLAPMMHYDWKPPVSGLLFYTWQVPYMEIETLLTLEACISQRNKFWEELYFDTDMLNRLHYIYKILQI